MSLPCKKPKSSRFSRFIAEFQQSSKRGVSLVLETRFPTSLIHLFVKNQERLKISSSKRLKRKTQNAQNASLPSKLEMTTKTLLARETKINNFVGDKLAVEKEGADNNVGVCGGSVRSDTFILMAFRVFLVVVVFALSTKKKFTMGITLSTFALLLTELVAVRVFTRSKLQRKPVDTIHDNNAISCKTVESFDVSKKSLARDLLLKDEKSRSKSSRLKSKLLKKLRIYKKNTKKASNMVKEEYVTEVSSLASEDEPVIIEFYADKKEPNPSLMRSEGDYTNGIVLIVVVLIGLLSGKMLAIGLTVSCLFLSFGAYRKSDLCK